MGHPIITPAEMAEAERAVFAGGTNSFEVMQTAGRAVARHLHTAFPDGRVRVLCGPGGNGGDGLVAADWLSGQGRKVDVYLMGRRGDLSGDTARAAALWSGDIQPLEDAIGARAQVTLDALFGGGLSRPLEGAAAALAGESCHTVSVDVPSGVDGATGRPLGPCFQADLTVTFAALRPAHVLEPGRHHCGQIEVTDIGVPITAPVRHNTPDDWIDHLPIPAGVMHKHARGRLAVVTGGPGETGAARLAARAGLRGGAGLVTLLCPPSALLVIASHITAEMVRRVEDADALASAISETADTVIIGPAAGVSDATREKVLAVLGSPAGAVLDADALSVFADAPEDLFGALRPSDVMTPHPGEFARLFGDLLEVSANRIEAARTAAERAGAVVLLKGADTVIAAPDGRAGVNIHATPWLATAGAGDVLAGLIGAQLCQGMPAFEAACAGAWMHGDAAQRFGPGLIATDIAGQMPAVFDGLMLAHGKGPP